MADLIARAEVSRVLWFAMHGAFGEIERLIQPMLFHQQRGKVVEAGAMVVRACDGAPPGLLGRHRIALAVKSIAECKQRQWTG